MRTLKAWLVKVQTGVFEFLKGHQGVHAIHLRVCRSETRVALGQQTQESAMTRKRRAAQAVVQSQGGTLGRQQNLALVLKA